MSDRCFQADSHTLQCLIVVHDVNTNDCYPSNRIGFQGYALDDSTDVRMVVLNRCGKNSPYLNCIKTERQKKAKRKLDYVFHDSCPASWYCTELRSGLPLFLK